MGTRSEQQQTHDAEEDQKEDGLKTLRNGVNWRATLLQKEQETMD